MSESRYEASRTGLLLVDPYNDFLSDGGKIWPMVKEVANQVGLLEHLRSVVAGARAAGVRIFFLPHRRWEPGDYESWDHPNPSQRVLESTGNTCPECQTETIDWHRNASSAALVLPFRVSPAL